MLIKHESKRDKRLETILLHYGAKGYGIYWLLLETITEKNKGEYPLIPYWEQAIAKDLNESCILVKSIVDLALKLDLLKSDGKSLTSPVITTEIKNPSTIKHKPVQKTKNKGSK